ncbi:acyl-CoA thioesterase [Salinisphaera sp. USBA-960]|uniref:acyl-CoA thioesterase n=1 Tax=Salinisphaera orenii TaxID=856731 RepID=UPI000DBE8F7B|nr:acyl-CoA thioesterase [Salifodinibacter halophilus]NNC25386.1 acyl-CoA thioesterase [Salifodinibacter halophilus]
MSDLETATVDIDVPFFDVDSMNMVWHGHYVKYFELARCQLLEQLGHDYQAMFDAGYGWPVVDMKIRYMRALVFKQPVCVAATLTYWQHRLKIGYKIRDRRDKTLLVRGSTTQAPIDLATGELIAERPAVVGRALASTGIE